MKNITITPEEQAELSETLPDLLKAIKEGNIVAPAWLAAWRNRKTIPEQAQEQAEEIKQEVIKAQTPEQMSFAQWFGFPTDLTRCSPFFPINVKELGKREYLEGFIITSANWGEIKYTGPKLSTYEEDVLMSLLAVLNDVSSNRQLSEIEERKTYTYKGPALPLLKLLGQDRPGKTNYNRLIASLKRLTVAGVELSISAGKTKSGKKREPRITQMSAMLAGVHWDDEKKELTATINPFFYETYIAGRVTPIDIKKRMSLKGLISKALYRFMQSQKDETFTCHFLTLADALNMDREQPAKKVRQLIKTAISELTRQGILTKKSGFVDTEIIKLTRAKEALPGHEAKKKITI